MKLKIIEENEVKNHKKLKEMNQKSVEGTASMHQQFNQNQETVLENRI